MNSAIEVLNDMQSVFNRIRQFKAPTNAKSQQNYIETLQQLAGVLADASSNVRVLVNSITPVNSLPPELLAHIFSIYATEDIELMAAGSRWYRNYSYPSPRLALRLTQICKHWRGVALSTPSLWSTVICGPGGRDRSPHDHYLHRSRSAPLHAIVRGDPEIAFQLFTDQPSRIRHLLITDTTNWTRRHDPQTLIAIVAPDLLTCTVDFGSWPRGPSLPELSYSLFSGHGKGLRELVIHSTRMIPTDTLPNLTVLKLYNIYGIPSLPHILALLSRCPTLEEVCVHSSREVAQIPQDSHPEPVALPRLRKLSLLIQRSTWLLSRLEIPPTDCLVRMDEITLGDLPDLPHTPLFQQRQTSSPAGAHPSRLRISQQNDGPIHTGIVSEFRIELADRTSRSGICLTVHAHSSAPIASRSAALADVVGASSLFSHITVLWAVRPAVFLVLTAPILRAMPALAVLGIVLSDANHAAQVADVLTAGTGDRYGDGDGRLVCPHLATLCVHNCQKKEGAVKQIGRVVSRRAQAGHRVKRLAIECVDALHALANALGKHVDEIAVYSRADEESSLPEKWREGSESLDNGVWPDWGKGLM